MTRRHACAVAAKAFALLASGFVAVPELALAVQSSRLKFEIYQDAGSEYRWRLKAANGRVIATSGEGYQAKADCRNAIALIKRGASSASIVEVQPS